MAWDFALEGKCPNCAWDWSNKKARFMAIEAMQLEAVFGGWTRDLLERMNDGLPEYESGICEPDTVDEDGNATPGNVLSFEGSGQEGEVALELAKYVLTKKREARERNKFIQSIDGVSDIDDVLKSNPADTIGV